MAFSVVAAIVCRQTFESERPFEREFEGIRRFEPISRLHESQVAILHVGRQEDCFYYVMELADHAMAEVGGQRAEVRKQESEVEGSRSEIPKRESFPPRTPAPLAVLEPATYTPRTLRSDLKRRSRLSFAECLHIALKLTEALQHLHEHGLVHRDIKPSNVIFVNGRPKLADIGLVAHTEATLSFVGTEEYLPPEGPGKASADVDSLGKVIYEISTGRDRNECPELPTMWESKTRGSRQAAG